MKFPLLRSIGDLDRGPRRFLLFTGFNVVSWQCIVGPALILLARYIEMPASWVGLLISFMPLSTLLVVVTVPLVMRYGSKRLMFSTWLLRNIVACGVFLMPWAMHQHSPHLAWAVLIAVTLGFCVIRAIGAGGWFPWLHEVVPEGQRGAFFSSEAAVAQCVNVVIIMGQGIILQMNPSMGGYLSVYAIGITAGMISLLWMARVPGGRGVDAAFKVQESYGAYVIAWRDRAFVRFVITAALCFSSTAWFSSAIVLYMRDILAMPSWQIMAFMALGSAGVLFTIGYWGRFADHSGSGYAIFLTLIAHSVFVLVALTLTPGSAWTPVLLVCTILPTAAFGAAFWMSAHRALLNYVQEKGRVGYTNAWTVGTALSLGLTPILAGQAIEHFGMWGYRFCFLLSGAAGLACAIASRWVVKDVEPIQDIRSRLFDPLLPVRTFARIAWITAGMHSSSRGRRSL